MIQNCPSCGGSMIKPYVEYLISSPDPGQKFGLMKCRSCDLVFTHPQPDPEWLARIYSDEDYYAYQPILIPPIADMSNPVVRIRQWAKSAVIEHYYGYGQASVTFKTNNLLRFLGRLIRNLPREDMLIMRRIVSYGGGGKHLDIGSGSGAYVWWMKKHGWQSEGIELNDKAVDNARKAGLDVKKSPLLESGYPSQYFDLITAWGVMEHLPRINDCFGEISRIIKPGGRFVGFVPNVSSWDAMIFKDKWQGFEIPSHLYHFNPSTLERLLLEYGFKVTGIEFLPGLDSWKATLDKMGIKTGIKRKILEASGRMLYMVSNNIGRGAMFRFDSVKT